MDSYELRDIDTTAVMTDLRSDGEQAEPETGIQSLPGVVRFALAMGTASD